MEKRVVSHSAPYGHACMSCFKGKCRCIPRQDGDGCERCYRLKKHCVPSNQVRRRTLHHGPELDGQITSRSNSKGNTTTEPRPRVQVSVGLEDPENFENALHPFFAMGSPGTSDSITPEPLGSSPGTCLNTFRSLMLPHFPFVHLPAHMTAQQLHLRRPFLSQAIRCVASSTARERRARAAELKRVFHEMAFYPQHRNGPLSDPVESTLDLLLGVLIYIAWGWDHSLSIRLTMLAMSLIGEMGLHMAHTPSDADLLGLLSSDVNLAGVGHSRGHTLEEYGLEYHRALLACFLLSAAVSAYYGQLDALRWTPQLERALVAISDTDSQGDHVLAVQVRLQLLKDRAAQMLDQGHKQDHNAAEILLIKFEELRPAAEQHQETGSPLASHLHHTELAIHEALDATAPLPAPVTACPPPSVQPTTTTTTPPPNLTHLWNALLAIQSTTAALLSLPTSSPTSLTTPTTTTPTNPPPFRGISFPQWAQLTRCITALHRFEAPDVRWPDGAAREVVDLVVLLDEVVGRLEVMAREAGEVVSGGVGGVADEGTFIKLVLGLRGFRERVLRERTGRGKAGGAGAGRDGSDGADVGGTQEEGMVLAPQKGYFRNSRFWLDQIWDRVDS
ncbi:hypothetical protein F5144DRAFT_639250 [Chaetomium tenue]|uniref:Uncharacterized protein n=1 Tax=Chaetomium tenue TaxID=1854479 RepID=A0ACB7PSS3_9PEZI|nr:hypothetical protein F5144DRAFT_639250 [Chaetomium globosum]